MIKFFLTLAYAAFIGYMAFQAVGLL